jgi:hypothetical protein
MLLLGSIASDVDESSLCGGYLRALGFGACGTKFNEYGLLFIGLLGPTRRGDGVLYFLSVNQTLIRLHSEDIWKGMNFGMVTIWKPNFRPGKYGLRQKSYLKLGREAELGWVRVKAFSLLGSDQVSWVRSDYGLGNRVKEFSLSVAIGLTRLGRVNLV